MIFKQNNKSERKRVAATALAFLLSVLFPSLVSADYSMNGYTVKWTSGNNIKVVDSKGRTVYEGQGVENAQGRLAPPKTSGLNDKIQVPNVVQGYAKSNSSQYKIYQGEVAITQNGKVVGWGSLYDDNYGKGHVYVNREGIHSSEIANGKDSWIRDNAKDSGYSVDWNSYAGGLGQVDLSKKPSDPPRNPPRDTASPPYAWSQPRYYTETASFAGVSVEESRTRKFVGETKQKTGSSYYTVDGEPSYETSQYVQGDYLYTVTTKKWTRSKYEKQTWTTYQQYETTIRSKTPWYHRYTQYRDSGGYRSVVSSWTDSSPFKWEYSTSTVQELVPIQTTTQDVLVNSWQEQTQSVSKEWAKVSVRAELSPNQARRGDTVTVTASTSGPATSVSAQFPSGTVQLRSVGYNQWTGTYLVDVDDGTYPVTVKAIGRSNEAKTSVSLVVSGDRYHVISNITGGN